MRHQIARPGHKPQPDFAHPKRAPRSNNEHRLQTAVAQHLKLRLVPGVWWTSIDHATRDSRLIMARASRGVKPGIPDMLFLIDGVAHFLELKTATGKESISQTVTSLEIRAAGGAYACAYGIDEALTALEGWGVIKPSGGTERQARAA